MRYVSLQRVARAVVFGGWLLPAVLARLVPLRLGADAGAGPARAFNAIAGTWAFLAVVYGVVLAVRMRRDLSVGE